MHLFFCSTPLKTFLRKKILPAFADFLWALLTLLVQEREVLLVNSELSLSDRVRFAGSQALYQFIQYLLIGLAIAADVGKIEHIPDAMAPGGNFGATDG